MFCSQAIHMAKLKKIKILSLAKFQSLLFALLGLLAGILYSFGGLLIDTLVTLGWIVSSETPGLSHGTILAFGALIGMPLILGAIGFIFGILAAILYNLFAKWFGGIDLKKGTLF
jgi:hypothetical protein